MLRTSKRDPVSGQKATSVVLLLHGLGTNGEDLISLADEWASLLPDTAFLAPDAPQPCDMGPFGYQWFSLQEPHENAILAGVQDTAPVLGDYIDEVLRTYAIPPEKLALVGFSQGTIMSLYVAPRRAHRLAGVLGYSGLAVGADRLASEKKSSPEIMLIHGTEDPVIPYRALGESEKRLKEAGLTVSTLTCPGLQHGIDGEGVKQGGAFLKKILEA